MKTNGDATICEDKRRRDWLMMMMLEDELSIDDADDKLTMMDLGFCVRKIEEGEGRGEKAAAERLGL